MKIRIKQFKERGTGDHWYNITNIKVAFCPDVLRMLGLIDGKTYDLCVVKVAKKGFRRINLTHEQQDGWRYGWWYWAIRGIKPKPKSNIFMTSVCDQIVSELLPRREEGSLWFKFELDTKTKKKK